MTRHNDFWTRRKAAVKVESEQRSIERAEEAIALKRRDLEDQDDAEILQQLNLPDPDTLVADDDLSAFLNDLVPERLRRRALRRFWRINPVLANVDGLVEYGEDYTDAATVIENLQTAYQVGKGMLSHIETLATPDVEPDEDVACKAEAEPVAQAEIGTTEPEAAPAAETGDEAGPFQGPRGDRPCVPAATHAVQVCPG